MGPGKNQKAPRFARNAPQNNSKLRFNLGKNGRKSKTFFQLFGRCLLTNLRRVSGINFYSATKAEELGHGAQWIIAILLSKHYY